MSGDVHATALAGNPHLADLELALRLADAADVISSSRFGALDLHVETKPDHTPVSDADRAVERAIRDVLAKERPGDHIYGEEYGGDADPASTGRRWILDPIDGTKSYVCGVPVWATLIGLEIDGHMAVGVASAPALHSRWFAAAGGGAYMGHGLDDARRIRVSGVSRVEDASLGTSALAGWRKCGMDDRFIALTDRVWRTRGYGDFWQYMLVAQGAMDAAVEPELDVYDMAALVPIVTEAGGRFTDLNGRPGPWGGCALATNGLLHEEILDALR